MFFLIEDNVIKYSTTLKKNTIIMLLNFCKNKAIKKIVLIKDFSAYLSEGEYLVQLDEEGFVFSHMRIIQSGIIFNCKEIVSLSKVHLQEFLPVDTPCTPEEKTKLIGELDLKIIF